MTKEQKPRVIWRSMPVCAACWTEHNPDSPAGPFNDGPIGECIACEQMTTSGIFVRMRVEWR